ncbi:hypothetical protein BZA05DRAFT_437568 [Tricharina praecox]|uniref:uncharacterized protein n=1 Tax=Tricharina praecox TaxID=43433 RepID=UPI00221F665A|nr:uncharacterized protein BZA05DRAFT_437568 [Tricharina praecox]KAI5848337.1 hypothetical protein BZA05DRAFT_437568 [Tricharina praecox]
MAKPFALATGIFSTFALIDRLIGLTTRIGASAIDALADIARLHTSLRDMNTIQKRSATGNPRKQARMSPGAGLDELTKGLESLELKKSKRMRWALGEDKKFAKSMERLETYKTLFAVAIAAGEKQLAQNSREVIELLKTDLKAFQNEEKSSQEAVTSAVHAIEKRQRLSSDVTKSLQSRQLEERSERTRREEEGKFEKLVTDTFNWFGSIDTKANHDSAWETCMPDSGTWFTKGEAFSAWRLGEQPYLWLNGIPGAGKSILMQLTSVSSSTIEALRETVDNEQCCIAYHYFTFTDVQKARADRMIESIVTQVAHQGWRCKSRQVVDVICRIYRKYEHTPQRPSASELLVALSKMVGLFE